MSKLTRSLIEQNTVSYLRTAGGTRPDLRVVDMPGARVVVKDFRRSDFLFRLIVGPILIRREAGALRKLSGVEGIPQLVARVDRYALAIQHAGGVSLEKLARGALTDRFYDDLTQTVRQMHARGVAHCDLRSRGNVILGDDSRPYVVDFAACVFRGRGINPFFLWLFRQFVAADENAILRIKQRLSPELLTEDDRAALAKPLPFERPAQFVGTNVRKLTRRLLTRRRS